MSAPRDRTDPRRPTGTQVASLMLFSLLIGFILGFIAGRVG